MADYTVKKVGEFPAAVEFNAEDVLFAEQSGKARKLSGELLQEFCRAAIDALVERAEDAAEDAEDAKNAIVTLEVNAETLEEGKEATASADFVEGKLVITIGIPKGDKGETGADGTVSFDDLTDEQKESLKGEKGDSPVKGEDYWTDEDKAELVEDVLEAMPVAEEESF